jgi:hypothetical protein
MKLTRNMNGKTRVMNRPADASPQRRSGDQAAEIGKQPQTRRVIPSLESHGPDSDNRSESQAIVPHHRPNASGCPKINCLSEKLLAKVTRMIPDIATLDDVIFAQEQLAPAEAAKRK